MTIKIRSIKLRIVVMGGGVLILHPMIYLAILGVTVATPVFAQQNDGTWSPPEVIFSTGGNLATSNIALVADKAGQLHLFFPHKPNESLSPSIDYIYWDGVGWSEPIDILVDPDGGSLSFVRAAIDSQHIVHLVWHGSGNKLRYTSAPLAQASLAQAWSQPQTIGDVVGEPDLIAGSNGVLYVAYSDASELGEVSVVHSTNSGKNWSSPVSLVLTPEGTAPDDPRLALDGAGRLHATWTEYELPEGWPPTGAFYTRSLDGGLTWEAPQQIVAGLYGQIGVTAVGQDDIHLVWRSTADRRDGTFHQWSNDGGETWSPLDHFEDGGGFSGLPEFAIDSAGILHYVIGPAKATTWQNGNLGAYVDVAGASLRLGDNPKTGWTDPERANIAITTGNKLHVVFETSFKELWHTYRLVDAPIISAVALPTVALPTPTLQPTKTPTPTPTTIPESRVEVPLNTTIQENNSFNPGEPVLLAIIPVIIIIGGIILFRVRAVLLQKH